MFKKAKKGFTIVELVIVIAVIGILSGILIPTFANLTSQAETTALKSNLANAYAAYAQEAADGKVDVGGEKIEMLAQDKVFVVPETATDEKGYIFNQEWNTNAVTFAASGLSGTKTLVSANAAKSTFLGFVFYYGA